MKLFQPDSHPLTDVRAFYGRFLFIEHLLTQLLKGYFRERDLRDKFIEK